MSSHRPRWLDRQCATQWVLALLRTELLAGTYADDPLPSENHLIERYGVSRGIVREALTILREQGVIDRVRGAGTFAMTAGLLQHGIEESHDIVQEVNAAGTRLAVRTIYLSRHPAPPLPARRLGVPTGEPVVILEQLNSLDGYPFIVRTSFLRNDLFGALVDDESINRHRSPYDLMEALLGTPVGDTELSITCSGADSLVAAWLDVPAGTPVFDSRRVVQSRDGQPLEFGITYALGHRVAFNTVMRARPMGNDLADTGLGPGMAVTATPDNW